MGLDGTSWELEPAQHLAHSSVLTSTGCQPAIASHYVSIPTINTNTMVINTTNIMVIETINTTTTMDIFTATTILVIIARLQDTHPIHLYSTQQGILKVQCPRLDLFTVIQVEISDKCVFPGFESKQVNYKLQAT